MMRKIVIGLALIMLMIAPACGPSIRIDRDKALALEAHAVALFERAEVLYHEAVAIVATVSPIVEAIVVDARAPTSEEIETLRVIGKRKDELILEVKQLLDDVRKLPDEARGVIKIDNSRWAKIIAVLEAILSLL